jgi:hypothetical protein
VAPHEPGAWRSPRDGDKGEGGSSLSPRGGRAEFGGGARQSTFLDDMAKLVATSEVDSLPARTGTTVLGVDEASATAGLGGVTSPLGGGRWERMAGGERTVDDELASFLDAEAEGEGAGRCVRVEDWVDVWVRRVLIVSPGLGSG